MNLKADAAHAGVLEGRPVPLATSRLKGLWRRVEERNRTLQRLRQRVTGKGQSVVGGISASRGKPEAKGGPGLRRINPANMVWIFGSGRSGSTWLRSMMAEMEGHLIWEEPMVGRLFGGFYEHAQTGQLGSVNFIMGDPTREGWIRSIRSFVLDGAVYRHPNIGPKDYLIVKEPNGTEGAPLLMEALPESRMIFLIRDPRDVVASVLEGAKKGNWLYERKNKGRWKDKSEADTRPNAVVRRRAANTLRYIERAQKAYEAHGGPKVLVRYEELRADTLGTMRRIYSTLGIPFEERELARAVEKHAWENIPAEKKGEGKFYRKATPGSWREDLTPKQVQIVEEATAPLLEKYYSE